MRVDAFDFDLPEKNIALRPARPRDSARLLVIGPQGGSLKDECVGDLASFLEPGDVLVYNDTKVIPARLRGTRRRVVVAHTRTVLPKLKRPCTNVMTHHIGWHSAVPLSD